MDVEKILKNLDNEIKNIVGRKRKQPEASNLSKTTKKSEDGTIFSALQ